MNRKSLKSLALVLLLGCSQRDQLQPRQSNVWLVSERREIAIGEEVAKEVEREFPLYQNAELTAYIDQIGQNLAKNSDRPNIAYTFKVLDSPIANAFATPGGHIYISRGILGVLDDEAEIAGVIGHEIGHVAARHSAKQMQASMLAQIGFVAVALLGGSRINDDVMQAANIAANLFFLGYSRGDEDQADILGAKYLYRTGYDPQGMIGAMEGLLELDRRNPMKAEQFMRSHPLTRERVEHIRAWMPRIPKEDVWGGIPPQTALRGVETFQRIAAPHAEYGGGDEMRAVMENYRIGIIRGQHDLVVKTLSDDYKDAAGRSKSDYVFQLDQMFAQAKKINYKLSNIESEPQRTGGAAKFDYVLEVTDKNSGAVSRQSGRAYLEFVRPEPWVWKISSIRTVPS